MSIVVVGKFNEVKFEEGKVGMVYRGTAMLFRKFRASAT